MDNVRDTDEFENKISKLLRKAMREMKAMRVTICTIPLWFLVALGIWGVWLK